MIRLKEIIREQGTPVQPSTQNQFEPAIKQPATTAKPVQAPAPVKPQTSVQQQIFSIKTRLNQLALNTVIKKFQMSLQSFKNKVTRNTTDAVLIQKYLAPLMGDVESLKGNIEALEAELKKLDGMTKAKEQ